ncbi:Syntaxin-binding protein 3 [Terramyces sp. JEL0728]|nr:Syntaxin-binding protein 3 [Terramyces sp. JEL0728]
MSRIESIFNLKTEVKKADLADAVKLTDSNKILICCPAGLELLNRILGISDLLQVGISITLALNGKRKTDRQKGAIYFCFPTKNFLSVFNNDFGDDPMYKEAYFISPIKTPNDIVSSIRKSPCRRFVLSWVDGRYDFNVFDSRSFHFDMNDSISLLYQNKSTLKLDNTLDDIAEKVPNIKYFDPNGAGTNLAARAAWKVYQKAEELEETKQEWPADNITADLLIIDRSADTLTPILHDLYYQSIIQDLFYVEDGKKLHLPTDEIRDEKIFELSDKDQFFMKLRHMYLGEVGEQIAKFIAENPAANEYYNRGTAELDDKVYSLLDAQKIQQHSVIFQALCKAYQENKLDTIVEMEQSLATGESGKTNENITNAITHEVIDIITNPTITIDDKLRLLLVCHHRFAVGDVNEESVQDLARDGFSGVDIMRSGKKIPIDESDPMDYFNSWFTSLFTSVEEEEAPVVEELERGNGLVIPFTKGFSPSWGRMKPENADAKEFVDFLQNGKRVIVFVLGGMSISEIQTIHEGVSAYNRDIIIGDFPLIIGSTNLITPNMFASDICKLGENDSGMPRLLPPIKPLLKQEFDIRTKKKLKVIAEQERLRREEEEEIEKEKQIELDRLQSQMRRVNIEEGRQKRLQEALADADDGFSQIGSKTIQKLEPMPRSLSPSNISLDRPGYLSLQEVSQSNQFQNVTYASQQTSYSANAANPPALLQSTYSSKGSPVATPRPPFSDKYQPTQYTSLSYMNDVHTPTSNTASTPSTLYTNLNNPAPLNTGSPMVQFPNELEERSVTSTVFTKGEDRFTAPTTLEVKQPLNDQISRTTSIKSLDSVSSPSEAARRENSSSSIDRKVDVKKLFQRPTVTRRKSDKLTKMASKYRELAFNSTRNESASQFENFIPPTQAAPQSDNAGNQRFPQRRVVPASATRVPNSGRNFSHDSYSDGNSPYSQTSPNSTNSNHPNLPYNQPQPAGYPDYGYNNPAPSPPPVRRQVYAPPQGPNWTQAALAQGGPPQLIQRQQPRPPQNNYQNYHPPNRPEPPSPQFQGIGTQQFQSPQQYQAAPQAYRGSQHVAYDNRNSQYDNRSSAYGRPDYNTQYDNRSSGYDRQDNRNSQYDARQAYDRQQGNYYGNQGYNQSPEQYRPQYDNYNRQQPVGADQYRYQGYNQAPDQRNRSADPKTQDGFAPPSRGPYRPGQYQPRPPI